MTEDRAAKRYYQIRALEQAVTSCEGSMVDVEREIDEANERLSELRATKRSLLKEMREAARDESQLPLVFGDGPVEGTVQ